MVGFRAGAAILRSALHDVEIWCNLVRGGGGPSSSGRRTHSHQEGGQAGIPASFHARRNARPCRRARRDFWWISLACGRRSYAARATNGSMECHGLAGAASVFSSLATGSLFLNRGGSSGLHAGQCEEAGGVARWYRWCRTSDLPPRLERVEEETPTVMEVVNETPADLCGRKVVSAPPEVPWTHVDAACPASASRSTESA